MAESLHLVRHGEVENPDHVVYADLQEFELSQTGRAQAETTAAFLSDNPISLVCSSPLTRAVQTASAIAAPHRIPVVIIDELTEFGLSMRWRGYRWEDLDREFPGEVQSYLKHPWDLPFSPESLDQLVDRMETAIRALDKTQSDGEIVVVSHQDPVQAARLALTGRPLSLFGEDKPEHAEVTTLTPGDPWLETLRWEPPIKSGRFPPPADDHPL